MNIDHRFTLVPLLLICASTIATPPKTGSWRAWLDSPGGELPFGLALKQQGDRWSAEVVNGRERIRLPNVTIAGNELRIDIDHYDAVIDAKITPDGKHLDGQWRKTTRDGKISKLPFHARAGKAPRFPVAPNRGKPGKKLASRWSVNFEKSDDPAIMLLEHRIDGRVDATIMTTTGDYRFLEGVYDQGRLRFSVFDGAHAFLFDATMQSDGGLAGHFWSRDVWHETFTADPDPTAKLDDGFHAVEFDATFDISTLEFPGLDGRTRKFVEPSLSGSARVIEIFGSWCPNCHDASAYLQSIHEKYHADGLRVIGIAFELTGDFKRDARQVSRFIDRHNITYPMLLAGKADKGAIPGMLQFLKDFRAYPTTVFVGPDNRIKAVHTGFAGPATGQAHDTLRTEYERIITEMLNEAAD